MLLKAEPREVVGKQVKTYRKNKQVPASVYGPSTPTQNLVVNDSEFRALFKDVGYSKLFNLEVTGAKPIKALMKEVQIDRLKHAVIHASIYAVDMAKAITTNIPVHIIGFSMAVKNNLGLLVTPMSSVAVSCLPENLPNELVVDISKLDNVGDSIFLKDLKIGEGVTLVGAHAKDFIVAAIASPQKSVEEEEAAAAPAAVEGEAAEGEAAEGAEATPAKEGEKKAEAKK